MAISDHRGELGIGLDPGRQLVTQDIDQVVAGKQRRGFTISQSFLGQKHQRHHDERHVMMPGLPTPDLIIGHPAGALGILEGAFDQVAGHLHIGQAA